MWKGHEGERKLSLFVSISFSCDASRVRPGASSLLFPTFLLFVTKK